MLERVFVIAHKELRDNLRDRRALFSTLAFTLMGPAILFMVSVALRAKQPAASASAVLSAMASVFVIVASFIGGLNISIDILAGERERKSLLPLLLNGLDRGEVLAGKWIAVVTFSVAALALNLVAFIFVLGADARVLTLCALLPLALFAAAAELAVSTFCGSTKEAHTWLSMLLFVPMGVGFFQVFFPTATTAWAPFVPVLAQLTAFQSGMRGQNIPALQLLASSVATLALTALCLLLTGQLLKRDDVVYGK